MDIDQQPSAVETAHSSVARQADSSDAEELVRLRAVMLASMHGIDPGEGEWREIAAETLRQRLSDPDGSMAAFVVDAGAVGSPAAQALPGTHLAACAVGVIESRLGGPENPSGQIGYIFNVVTDDGQRRQGFSRACMEALLAWFGRRGVTRIDLAASSEGEPLYQQLGFKRSDSPRMRLHLSR